MILETRENGAIILKGETPEEIELCEKIVDCIQDGGKITVETCQAFGTGKIKVQFYGDDEVGM